MEYTSNCFLFFFQKQYVLKNVFILFRCLKEKVISYSKSELQFQANLTCNVANS